MHWLDVSILIIYLVALIILGFIRSNHSNKDPEDYLLAGRKLSLPGFVVTIVATWYGGILGIGENTYSFGIQTWFIFALPYYIFALLFALFIAGRINQAKYISLPDQFHNRYGKTAGIISAIYILALASPAPYILSIGILIQFISGFSFGISLIIATTISMSYIFTGGFKAVVRTDKLQFGFMFLGFALLLIYSIKIFGGYTQLAMALPKSHLSITGGASLQYILVWFFIAIWTFVDPGFYQRCAAAKSPKTAQNGIIISIIFWFLFDILTLSTGLYAKAMLTGGEPLFAYPRLGALVLPPIAYGIFITGLLATIMSTIDSLGMISAITFGRDILWQISNSSNPDSWKDQSTSLIHKGLGVTSFIALALAFSIPSVVKLWYNLGSIIVPGLVIPFLMSFNKNRIQDGIIFLMVCPALTSIIWIIYASLFGNYPFNIEPFYPGVIISCLIYGWKIKNGKRNRT
jgi:SSS family solute:Na+ symporter